jgi:hypothetical protein|nr:MAG TPA: hypothetical protein [Caudoviricetes sp.]
MELTKLEKALIDKISEVSDSEELWYNNYQEMNEKMAKLENEYKALEDKYNALLATTVPEEKF